MHHMNKAICVSCSKEGDPIGLLMFTYYLRKRGIEVINIGTYGSEVDIYKTMEIIHPDLFIFSCEEQNNLNEALSLIKRLSLNHKEYYYWPLW